MDLPHPRLSAIALAALTCGPTSGQAPITRPAFEVVSIKPVPQGTLMDLIRSGRMHSRIDDVRVDLGSVDLSTLIQLAYRLPEDRISGPGWLREARFDILAKLPAGA